MRKKQKKRRKWLKIIVQKGQNEDDKKKRSIRPFYGRRGVEGGQSGWRVIFNFFVFFSFSKTLQSTQHIYKLELKLAFERKFITYTGRADSR